MTNLLTLPAHFGVVACRPAGEVHRSMSERDRRLTAQLEPRPTKSCGTALVSSRSETPPADHSRRRTEQCKTVAHRGRDTGPCPVCVSLCHWGEAILIFVAVNARAGRFVCCRPDSNRRPWGFGRAQPNALPLRALPAELRQLISPCPPPPAVLYWRRKGVIL